MIFFIQKARKRERVGYRDPFRGERLFLSQFRLSQKYRGQKRVLFARVHRRRRGGQRAYTTARKKPAKTQRAIVARRPGRRKKRHGFARRAASCRPRESCRISRADNKARQTHRDYAWRYARDNADDPE